MNFFSVDISWACIDADLFNTIWDILLTDVNTDEMNKVAIISLEICKKKCSVKGKSKKTPKYPETERL